MGSAAGREPGRGRPARPCSTRKLLSPWGTSCVRMHSVITPSVTFPRSGHDRSPGLRVTPPAELLEGAELPHRLARAVPPARARQPARRGMRRAGGGRADVADADVSPRASASGSAQGTRLAASASPSAVGHRRERRQAPPKEAVGRLDAGGAAIGSPSWASQLLLASAAGPLRSGLGTIGTGRTGAATPPCLRRGSGLRPLFYWRMSLKIAF